MSEMIGLMSDTWIRRMARDHGMIEPFVEKQRGDGVISYGLSSYGYDARLGTGFKSLLAHANRDFLSLKDGPCIDPVVPLRLIDVQEWQDTEYILAPGDFVLAHTLETFSFPPDVLGLVKDKSTYARLGIAVQNTVLEPGWRGQITLEISNHGPRPVILRAGQGICQVLFLRGAEPCEVTYADRGGKYMDQSGVTLARVLPADRAERGTIGGAGDGR